MISRPSCPRWPSHRSKARVLTSVAGAALLLGGCAEEPSTDRRAAGTVEMAERLARVAEELEPYQHPYITSARLDSVAALEPPADPVQRIQFEAGIAQEELHVGRLEEAIRRLEGLLAEARSGGRVPAEMEVALAGLLGTTHLKLWERENCVAVEAIRPCLFPIESEGRPVELETRPATAASARSAAELQQDVLEARPDDLTARWLLNIAYMMAGEYPEGVPPRFLIPPETWRSEYELGRFPEIAPELGLDVVGHAGGSIMDDFDRDGDLDIVASSWHLRDQLRFFRNEGDGTFTDRTVEAGLEGLVGGINLNHADYDNDGFLDILVLRGAWTPYGEPNSLLRNNGDGTFEDVTEAAGLLSSRPTPTASWGDYDNDGWLDLYVGSESESERRLPNQLFRNEGDGTFTDVAAEAGADVVGFVKAVAWGDYDNDGRLDLFISRLREPNLLLRNDGPDAEGRWTFSDVTEAAGVAEPLTSFPAWFWDYDNDGWMDIFVSGYRGVPHDVAADYLGVSHDGEVPRLYRNAGDGTFADVTAETGLDDVLLTMGSNYGDLDNDGHEDVYIGTGEANPQTMVPNRMYRNAAGERFQDVTTAGGFGHLGHGHGVAFGDLDHDGDQDIYATMGGAYEGDVARNVLFENPGHGNRWITLRLEGVRSNRSAIGARVRVTSETPTGRQAFHRVVSGGSSFGANSLQLEIGLGDATSIESVEVTWPATGTTDTFTEVEPDRVYRVREGDRSLTPVEAAPIRLGSAGEERSP